MANQYPKISQQNRALAKQNGEKIYLSGTPCKKCGTYEKYVSTYGCVKCVREEGIKKLNNEDLMKPYRTKEKSKKRLDRWREQNPEKWKEQNKRYPEKNNAKSAKRRAAVKNQTPYLTEDEIKQILTIYQECSKISAETGIPHEVDHIIPICNGGLHHPDNLQILTMKENRSKGSK